MIIQITGTGTHNRGAELMAAAIATHFREIDASIKIAVAPRFGTFEERARYGFRAINEFSIKTPSRWLAEISPRVFRESVGLVHGSEVDAILDASGFAYSDQWGPSPAYFMNRAFRSKDSERKKMIFLPQAFGPFQNPDVANLCSQLFARADLTYARDGMSFEEVQNLGSARNLKLCPDFTQLLKGTPPETFPLQGPFTAIVPNVRMLDKTGESEARGYLQFLEHSVATCKRIGVPPIVVLHDADEDRKILPELFGRTGELPVFESADPLVLKGALGLAYLVIGSRFHALVSSLSQGVPCIGAGWSHKYRWLFEDFDCQENLVTDLSDVSRVEELIARTCDSSFRADIQDRLSKSTAAQCEGVEKMWREVDECLGLASPIRVSNSSGMDVGKHTSKAL